MAIRRNTLAGPAGTAVASNAAPYGDPFTGLTAPAVYLEGGGVEMAPLLSGQSYGYWTEDQASTRFVAAVVAQIPTETLTQEAGLLGIVSGSSARTRVLLPTNLRPRLANGSTGISATQMPALPEPNTGLTPGGWYHFELAYAPDPGGTTGTVQFRVCQLDGTLIFESPILTHALTGSPLYRFGTGGTAAGMTLQRWRLPQAGPVAAGWIGPYPAAANQAPTANAGPDQTAQPGQTVTLAGTVSDSDGTATGAWTGPVSLGGSGLTRTFTAPVAIDDQTLTFTLTPTDNAGLAGAPDTVNVLVRGTQYARRTSTGWQPVQRFRIP